VPRTLADLDRQLEELAGEFTAVDTVNVPDLTRFDVRSWDACLQVRQSLPNAIPHLRAIDVNPEAEWALPAQLAQGGITEVIVVTGDAPVDLGSPVYPCDSVQLIRRLKRAMPGLKVYAALDPYRSGMREELDYAQEKLEAGASGFFTQPFFDLRMLDVWAEQLPDVPVFWGVTSVTAERSWLYWRNRNRAVFPGGFAPTLAWNREFAALVLEWARANDQSLYFMPIRSSLKSWLAGIL